MGGIFSSLNTSYTGLQAHQVMVDVASNNISNASDEFYSRQRALVHPDSPILHGNYNLGRGVDVDSVQRLHDEFVFSRYTKAAKEHNFYDESFTTLREVSSYFSDVEGVGIYNDLEKYFDAWKDISKNPGDMAQKQVLISSANTLTNNINDVKEKLLIMQRRKSEELEAQVNDANRLASQIADINRKLKEREDSLTLVQANELRDRRDELEFRLQEVLGGSLLKSKVRGNNLNSSRSADFDDGYVFNIGHGFSMIEGAAFHPITLVKDDNSANLNRIYIRGYDFKDVDITGRMDEGKVGALLSLYDTGKGDSKIGKLQKYMNMLDSFSRGLIESTNAIYAQSASDNMTSDRLSIFNNEALKDTNYNVKPGSLTLTVYSAEGDPVASKSIAIDGLTTMKSIVDQINANIDDNNDNNSINDFDDYFVASYDNNSKQFLLESKVPGRNVKVSIEDGGTNFTGALGINRFFEGNDAGTIRVSEEYRRDPTVVRPWLAPVNGNFEVANMMQQLQYNKVEFYENKLSKQHMKLNEFYQFVVGSVATDAQEMQTALSTKKAVLEASKKEHLAVSQVSVDEEMVSLIKFQSGYAANAKVVATIDKMIDALLGIKQ